MDLGQRLGELTAYEFRPGRGFDRQSVLEFRSLALELLAELVANLPAPQEVPAPAAPVEPVAPVAAPLAPLALPAPQPVPVASSPIPLAPLIVTAAGGPWLQLGRLADGPSRSRAERRHRALAVPRHR